VSCTILHPFIGTRRSRQKPGLDDIVPALPPCHVPLIPSKEKLEDRGDGMERTL
jgi:hypothetical protein